MSHCVCATCSAHANYVSNKSSKPEGLKALGAARSPSRTSKPQKKIANAVHVVLSISGLVCQRAGKEGIVIFSFANKSALRIRLCCIHNVLHVDMYTHICLMQYQWLHFRVLPKIFLVENCQFSLGLWRKMCTKVCARTLFLA